jgi:DMSO/TMAO reductase YedYZ molybdopterin-dependent catalytic subunit
MNVKEVRPGQREAYGGRLPPGQRVVMGWPVLTYGFTPRIDLDRWRLHLIGAVEREVSLTWDEFMALPQTVVHSDIHCVTGWSKLDNQWEGVLVREVVALCRPRPEAKAVMVHCYGGYTTNLLLTDLLRDDVLLAHKHNGQPLSPEHGWPLRLVVPHLYFWKSAKWVRALEFLTEDRPGFWETYGYHMRGDPWREERYA